MSENKKQTSKEVAHLAAETLRNPSAPAIKKELAGSALAQEHTTKQTSAEMAHKAGEVLHSPKYSKETKTLAASVLAQSSKDRKRKQKNAPPVTPAARFRFDASVRLSASATAHSSA